MCRDLNICSCRKPDGNGIQIVVKGFVELLGSFLLVFFVCISVNCTAAFSNTALAQGLGLMALVYTWGHVSGGHFNPAVSTALFICGNIEVVTWIIYIVMQCIGGILGGVVSSAVADEGGFPLFNGQGHEEGFFVEFIVTFLLCTTVCNVACTQSVGYQDNSFFGLAIGAVLATGIFLTTAADNFGVTSGAFNPCVLLGCNIGAKLFGNRDDIDVDVPNVDAKYWAAFLGFQFLAAILAGFFFVITENVVAKHSGGDVTDSSQEPEYIETTAYENKPVDNGYGQTPPQPAGNYM